jgi:putative ABC transport system ATP-binding protein
MPVLSRFCARLPLIGRWFGRNSARTVRPNAPAVLAHRGPTLVGEDLLRTFGAGSTRTHALKEVSVDLNRGEMNLLMGPSGSGKSTLLAVLSGLLRPDGGAVKALGQDVWRMSDVEMERFRLRHCSYIFQGYNLFPALTARQQLEVVLRWGEGVSGSVARKRADHVLGQLGLANRSHLRPAQLSGGEKQRVAIARALVKNPSFVFADEPTSALDWENGRQVMNLLQESARERGATVLVVTHDPRLEGYADRVFQMADGALKPATADTRLELDVVADTGLYTPLPTAVGPRVRLADPTAAVN